MVLRAAWCSPTVPDSHRASKRALRWRRSLMRFPQVRVAGVACGGAAQVGDEGGLQRAPGFGSVAYALAGGEEVAPDAVEVVAVPVAHERRVEGVGEQLVPGGVEDGDGCAGQAVQHAVDAGGDVPRDRAGPRWREAGQAEQVGAFVLGEPQGAGQRFDDLG